MRFAKAKALDSKNVALFLESKALALDLESKALALDLESKALALFLESKALALDSAVIMQKILILLIRGYQLFISPWLGSHCRFFPSCSEYTLIAIQTHGAFYGLVLGTKRILRCHPWHPGGYDPVPEKKENQ